VSLASRFGQAVPPEQGIELAPRHAEPGRERFVALRLGERLLDEIALDRSEVDAFRSVLVPDSILFQRGKEGQAPEFLAEAEDHQQRLVDRPQPDQRDEELDDDRDVGDVGQRLGQRERVRYRGNGDPDWRQHRLTRRLGSSMSTLATRK
jgi:hypothetical protein